MSEQRDREPGGPPDVLGGPDRATREDELGQDADEHEDELGGRDQAVRADELGQDADEHEDELGGPDNAGHEDILGERDSPAGDR